MKKTNNLQAKSIQFISKIKVKLHLREMRSTNSKIKLRLTQMNLRLRIKLHPKRDKASPVHLRMEANHKTCNS